MSDKYEMRKGKEESLLFLKNTKMAARLNIPSDGWIAINNTYAFTSYALWNDLGFKPGIFGTRSSDWDSASPSLLVPRYNFFKSLLCPGSNPRQLQAKQWLCQYTTVADNQTFHWKLYQWLSKGSGNEYKED